MASKHSPRIWFLCLFLLFTLTSLAFAGGPAQLEQAETLLEKGQYEQAEAIYKQIVTAYPGTDYAFQALEELTILYVDWYKQPEAEAALHQLIGDFSQHRRIAGALTHIADAYRRLEKHERACDLYRYVVDNWSKDDHALWSQMDLVISYTCLRDDSAADTAFKKLCSQYSGHKLMPKAICLIADNYRNLKRHKKGCELYQYVVDTWPDAEHALWSRMGLAMSNIELGNEDAAEDAVDELLADFSKDKRMETATCVIADEYRKSGKHQKACHLYQYVLDNWPAAEHALWSRMGLAISNVQLGYDDAAQAAVDKLLIDFFKDQRMETAACLIADEYRRLEKHESALHLYQYVVNTWPGTEHALWSQVGLAIANIRLGDDNAGWAGIETLVTEFSGDKNIAQGIQEIAQQYHRLGNYEKGQKIHQYVADVLSTRGKNERTIGSQAALAASYVALGRDAEALRAIDNLIADFSDDPDLPVVLWRAADAHYDQAFRYESQGLDAKAKEYFAKVISLGERIRQQLTPSTPAAEAWYFSGECYYRLGQYEKAIEYYEQVVGNWPDYERADQALFRTAQCFNELATSEHLPQADAGEIIQKICGRLPNDYPDSKMVSVAQSLSKYWESANRTGESK
jgi:TolA-binding protein